MKNVWFLVLAFGLAMTACSNDDEDVAPAASSVGGSAGSSSDAGGESSVAGSSASGGASESTGGTSSASGGASAVAGTSSTGGVSSGGTSSVAGASSIEGGASSVAGGPSAAGSSSTAVAIPVGMLSCGAVIKGDAPLVPVVIKHRPEYSSNMSATFYAGCTKRTDGTNGWGVLCPQMSCNGECACMTYAPSGTWIRMNIDRGSYRWAVGSLGNTSSLCPNNYDPIKGCLGKEDLIRNGFVFVNDVLMNVDQAEKNPQNNGYDFVFQVP